MKKAMYFVAGLLFLAGCTGNKGGNETAKDSAPVQDSASLTITNDTVNAPAKEQTLAADSTKTAKDKEAEAANKPSPNAKKIDKLNSQFMETAKYYKEAVENGMIGVELSEIVEWGSKLEKQLKKYEKEMTPAQKAKYKKAKKIWNGHYESKY